MSGSVNVWLSLLFPILCAAAAAESPVGSPTATKPLHAPPGVRFSRVAPTWEELSDAAPDLSWADDSNSRFMIWVSDIDESGCRTMTFDRAYLIEQGGAPFWALLSPPDPSESFQSSWRQFLIDKHLRSRATLPGSSRPDGRSTWAEFVSRSEDGRSVVRVFYPSEFGARPDQLDSRSWLIFFSGEGSRPELATIDLPDNQGYHVGSELSTRAATFEVVWHDAGAAAPFHLIAHESLTRAESWESEPNYTAYTDSLWSGPLPLGKVRSDSDPYAIADGRTSLSSLARSHAHFHNNQAACEQENTAQPTPEAELWQLELSKINPSFPADCVLDQGTRISLPPLDTTSRAIRAEVRSPGVHRGEANRK